MVEMTANSNNGLIVCKDCNVGRQVLQKIIINGHKEIIVYYRTVFGVKPTEMLPEICPELRPGYCPFNNKKDK